MTVASAFLVIEDGVTYAFEPAEEGGYVVRVPDAPGCWSEGDTFEEALANIKDALVGWVSVMREKGLPVAAALAEH
jgi:antitoxin HicB